MSLVATAEALGVGYSSAARDPLAVPAADVQQEMAYRLAIVAEYRDDDTGAHAARVAAICGALAARLGLAAGTARLLELAAPLHDLGKVAIPDAIRLKEGPLTDAERRVMQQHTTIGAKMLGRSRMPVLELARDIALSHHEHWDGLGYPHRIEGSRIPLSGRIVAIADVFDALMSDRPYKRAWDLSAAIEEIRLLRGTHFDPAITDAFLDLDHDAMLRVPALIVAPTA